MGCSPSSFSSLSSVILFAQSHVHRRVSMHVQNRFLFVGPERREGDGRPSCGSLSSLSSPESWVSEICRFFLCLISLGPAHTQVDVLHVRHASAAGLAGTSCCRRSSCVRSSPLALRKTSLLFSDVDRIQRRASALHDIIELHSAQR